VSVQTEDALSWRQDTTLGHFQLTLRATGGEVNPFTFFNDALNSSLSAAVGKSATRDFGRYSNPQADRYLALWAANPPGSQAARSAQAGIESVMVSDVPAIPVFFASSQAFWRTGAFTGFPHGPDPYPPPFGNIAGTPLVLTDLSPAGQ
jgi:peptide/nickel transport system substrate-binding protein